MCVSGAGHSVAAISSVWRKRVGAGSKEGCVLGTDNHMGISQVGVKVDNPRVQSSSGPRGLVPVQHRACGAGSPVKLLREKRPGVHMSALSQCPQVAGWALCEGAPAGVHRGAVGLRVRLLNTPVHKQGSPLLSP